MADVTSLITYYQGLLIKQYQGKPNALAQIAALAQLALMDGIHLDMATAFNINPALGPVAQGAQLDLIGQIVGVSRHGRNFSGPATLNDSDFLKLINIKIIQNHTDGTLYSIQTLLVQFFPDGAGSSTIRVFDHLNMRMSYVIETTAGTEALAEFIIEGGYLPKPMGVQLASTTYGTNISTFFGFRTYEASGFNNNPFNTYASYQTTWPWLSYDQGIT